MKCWRHLDEIHEFGELQENVDLINVERVEIWTYSLYMRRRYSQERVESMCIYWSLYIYILFRAQLKLWTYFSEQRPDGKTWSPPRSATLMHAGASEIPLTTLCSMVVGGVLLLAQFPLCGSVQHPEVHLRSALDWSLAVLVTRLRKMDTRGIQTAASAMLCQIFQDKLKKYQTGAPVRLKTFPKWIYRTTKEEHAHIGSPCCWRGSIRLHWTRHNR